MSLNHAYDVVLIDIYKTIFLYLYLILLEFLHVLQIVITRFKFNIFMTKKITFCSYVSLFHIFESIKLSIQCSSNLGTRRLDFRNHTLFLGIFFRLGISFIRNYIYIILTQRFKRWNYIISNFLKHFFWDNMVFILSFQLTL